MSTREAMVRKPFEFGRELRHDEMADRRTEMIRRVLRGIRPEVSYDPLTQSFTVGLGPRAPKTEVPALTEVLDGIDRLAAESGRPTAVRAASRQNGRSGLRSGSTRTWRTSSRGRGPASSMP